jgi:hypothetical protein
MRPMPKSTYAELIADTNRTDEETQSSNLAR